MKKFSFKKIKKPPSEEQETPISDISFVPSILPPWMNTCMEDRQNEPTNFENQNVVDYMSLTSFVGWKGRVDYALNHLEQDGNVDENFLLCLLENLISTVILTASGQTVPNDYIVSTTLFLKHIRNDSGKHPPNIALFLEYLKSKTPKEIFSIFDNQDIADQALHQKTSRK